MGLKDIRGQDRAVEILKRGLEQKRVAHAYLFIGPSGTGKQKTALEYAKLLNCSSGGGDACSHCPSCIKIEKSTHPDVILIARGEDSSSISIERIRDLQGRLSLKPFESGYKAAIIADAEHMTEEASNCLLKLLEEPTPDTVIILTASNHKVLPATIVSRCQIIRFRQLTLSEANDILIRDFKIKEKEARFLSAVSGGNIAKALMLKDEDALSWKNGIIDEFYKPGQGLDRAKAAAPKAGRRMQIEAMDILLGFYRDVLVYKLINDEGLIINIDRIDEIADLSRITDLDKIKRAIGDIEQIRSSIEANANIKLAVSVLKERLAL